MPNTRRKEMESLKSVSVASIGTPIIHYSALSFNSCHYFSILVNILA